MKLQLDKTVVSGTKGIRGTKSGLHGTPILIPIRAQGRADKTHKRGTNHYAIIAVHSRSAYFQWRGKLSWCKHGGYDGILKQLKSQVISAAKCRCVKTSMHTRQDNQVLWPPVYKPITSTTAARHAVRPINMQPWSIRCTLKL